MKRAMLLTATVVWASTAGWALKVPCPMKPEPTKLTVLISGAV